MPERGSSKVMYPPWGATGTGAGPCTGLGKSGVHDHHCRPPQQGHRMGGRCLDAAVQLPLVAFQPLLTLMMLTAVKLCFSVPSVFWRPVTLNVRVIHIDVWLSVWAGATLCPWQQLALVGTLTRTPRIREKARNLFLPCPIRLCGPAARDCQGRDAQPDRRAVLLLW